MDIETIKQEIRKLVEKHNKVVEEKRIDKYKEEETKKDFILPLFRALGWDVENSSEVTAEEKVSKKRVDYGFRINGIPKFFLEAKSLKEDLEERKFIEQAINYAWHKGCTWAVLTNFSYVRIYNAEWKTDNFWQTHFRTIPFHEFLDRFSELWLLSKESFEQGLIDKEAERLGKKTRKISVDKQLLADFTKFRELLSKNITKLNQSKNLTEEELDESVQRILDRVIFIRNCEDRELEAKILISNLREWESRGRGQLIKSLREVFAYFDRRYNSKIFANHLCDDFDIENEVLHEIIEGLYYTKDKSVSYDFAAIEADVLGNIYEQYLGHILKKSEKRAKLTENHAHRKEQGIYYTPTYIVDYIVKNSVIEHIKDKSIDDILNTKILDPACGSGSFLIRAFSDVCKVIEEKLKKGEKSDKWVGSKNYAGRLTLQQKITIMLSCIYGVDLDKKAVEIAQLNLLLKLIEGETSETLSQIKKLNRILPMLDNNIKCGNSLIDDPAVAGDKAFKWEQQFEDAINEGGFDVVIGNPPYFNIKSDDILKNSKDFKLLSSGVLNAASLFLKRGLDLLKDNGYLGFIIPKSFLIVDSWKPIRNIILENSLIAVRDVSMAFEEVGLEQVVVIVKKAKPRYNKVRILKGDKEINVISQEFFQKRGIILTSLNREKLMIIEKIEKGSLNLEEFAEMPRGITVKSSEYYEVPSEERIHVLGGTNVERYGLKVGGKRKPNRYLTKTDARIQQRNEIFRGERIIYQNIASSVPKIVATLELTHYGLPTDDTLNNLLISDSSLNSKYILAMLNSTLITFYLRYAIINCSLLTIHLDKPYLGKIPIKKISITEQQPLIKLVDRMLSLNKRLNEIGDKKTDERARIEEEIKKTDAEIDERVYRVYGITGEEKKIIEESLK